MWRAIERKILAGLLGTLLAASAFTQDRTPTPPAPGTPPADPYLLLEPPRELKPGEVRWSSDFDGARLEARVRNLPVFVLGGNDASPIMQNMLETVYLKPGFAAINDLAVPVIAMTGLQHPAEEVAEGDKKVRLCSYFKVPCEEHDRLFALIHERYITRQFSIPLHLYLQPSGDEFLRLEGDHTEKRLLGELSRLNKTMGPGLDLKNYRSLMRLVQESRELLETHEAKAALAKYEAAVRAAPKGDGVAELLKAELERLLEDGRDRLRIAQKLLVARRKEEALQACNAVATDYQGYPVADEAIKLRTEIENG